MFDDNTYGNINGITWYKHQLDFGDSPNLALHIWYLAYLVRIKDEKRPIQTILTNPALLRPGNNVEANKTDIRVLLCKSVSPILTF